MAGRRKVNALHIPYTRAPGRATPGTSGTLLRLGLALFLIPGPAAATEPSSPAPVVITTDCGADMDDQWAIAHAALSPRIATLAVIGGFAPEPHHLGSADTARCARQALASVDRLAGIPVHEGAGAPLPDRATPVRSEGAEQLIRLSGGFSPVRRLLVLGLGPVTDLASAILADPGTADRIEVVALAFDRYPQGGDGWNVRNDAAAWQVLLDADVPVTAASGYVALDHLNLTRGEAQEVMKGSGPPGAYLACLHGAWLDAFGAVFAAEVGGGDRWPVWDEAVVAHALGLTTWRELPRPGLGEDLSFSFPNPRSRAPFRWVVAIDRERVFGGLADLLGRLPGNAPGPSARTAPGPRMADPAVLPPEQPGRMDASAALPRWPAPMRRSGPAAHPGATRLSSRVGTAPGRGGRHAIVLLCSSRAVGSLLRAEHVRASRHANNPGGRQAPGAA